MGNSAIYRAKPNKNRTRYDKNDITILAGPEPHNMLSSITERKSYLLSSVIGLSNNLIK